MPWTDNLSICLSALWKTEIPDFSDFLQTPNDSTCKLIDLTKLEINTIISWNNLENKNLEIEWDFAFILSYKWDIACILGFTYDETGLVINQLQWTKKRWYRVISSINIVNFFTKLAEEFFLKKWIRVRVNIPVIEDFANSWINKNFWTSTNYIKLKRELNALNEIYFPDKSLDN